MSSVVEPRSESESEKPRKPFTLPQLMTPIQRQGSAAYKRELGRLLKEAPGKWVAFRGDRQIALADTAQELLKQIEAIGVPRNEIVVRGVEPLVPPVDFRLHRGRHGYF